jgi:hypothetical protein
MNRAWSQIGRPCLVVVLMAIVIGSTSPGNGATSRAEATAGPAVIPRQATPQQAVGPEPPIRLTAQSGWVAPSGQFHVQLDVASVSPGSEITATLFRAIKTRTALDQTGRGERLGAPDHAVTVPLTAAATRGPGRSTVDLAYQIVPSGADPALGFMITDAGVYPLQISITDPAGTVQAQLTTHLIRLPDQTYTRPPLTLALVLPVGTSPAHRPDGSVDLPTDQTAAIKALTATLGRYPSVPVSVAPTPETISALADTAGDDSITEPLRSKSLQLLTGTYVPVDSGSWLDQGLTDQYGQELAAGTEALRSILGTDPDRQTVLVDDHTTPEVLSLLAAGGATHAIVSRGRLEPTTARPEPTTLTQAFELVGADAGRLRSVATDTMITDRLSASTDPVLDAHEVLADLTLTALEPATQACVAETTSTNRCSRGVAVQLPTEASAAQPALDVLLAALADRTGSAGAGGAPPEAPPEASTDAGTGKPLLSPMTVTALLGVVDEASGTGTGPTKAPVERRLTATTSTPLGTYPAQLEVVTGEISGFRSMLVSGDPVGLDVATSLDRVASTSGSVSLDDGTRLAYLNGASATVRAQTGEITSPQQQVVTLTSSEGIIPISIENALDYPVRVRMVLTSSKLEFPDGNEQTVDLAAGTPTRVEVRVRGRASGAFPLEITLQSPDSTLPITSTRFNVRSTAVSGIGLVLTIIAGLFLLLWWARNFRNTRRDRKLITSSHPVLRSRRAPSGTDAI